MRSLLHQTTLTITAVLMLISCATQAQAIDGNIAGNPDSNLYASSHIERVAVEEGISDLEWIGGGVGRTFSTAQLTYGQEPAYMTCTTSNSEKAIFDALVAARNRVVNKDYSNYVKNPLKFIPVPEGPAQPAGNCFIYRNISGLYLEQFVQHKNYLDKLVILNQIIPQLLKGFIYLFNAGVTNIKLDLGKVRVQRQATGQLKVTISEFDVWRRPRPPIKQLYINTPPVTSSPQSPSPYACRGYYQALDDYISDKVDLEIAENPLNLSSDERMRIEQDIERRVGPAAFRRLTGRKLENAVKVYISVLRMTTLSICGKDCTSFAVALRSMLIQAQQAQQSRPQLL
ncbi:hypothetical protein BDF22DRAFT_776806 [Syncephalis plumigaleata]|nr:hypothetical protein BDF22DRAFT_776806 [Syncephalis plumigaleata]